LMKRLNVERPAAVGHVVCLWLWAIDNAPSGSLEHLTDADVAGAGQWHGDAALFVKSLRAVGFLDRDRTIHDWHQFAGKLVEYRAKDAERKRIAARNSSGTSAGGSDGNP